MTVLDALTKMQADAVEQLRAGDHNAFLVGFLTTSVKLELSNLVAADLDLHTYAQAVVEVLTQHAPLEQCLIGIDPEGLPRIGAAVGFDPELALKHDTLLGHPNTAVFTVDQVAHGTLHAEDVPEALRAAGFLDEAAGQVAVGLARVVESEHLRRKASAAKALRVVAGLDEHWNVAELGEVASAFAGLPGVTGATLTATAARFAGSISAVHGRIGPHQIERSFTVDTQLEIRLDIGYMEHPSADQIARLEELLQSLAVGLERIEQLIRLAAEADTDELTGVGNRRRAAKSLTQARQRADATGEPMSVTRCSLPSQDCSERPCAPTTR